MWTYERITLAQTGVFGGLCASISAIKGGSTTWISMLKWHARKKAYGKSVRDSIRFVLEVKGREPTRGGSHDTTSSLARPTCKPFAARDSCWDSMVVHACGARSFGKTRCPLPGPSSRRAVGFGTFGTSSLVHRRTKLLMSLSRDLISSTWPGWGSFVATTNNGAVKWTPPGPGNGQSPHTPWQVPGAPAPPAEPRKSRKPWWQVGEQEASQPERLQDRRHARKQATL